ncbi:TetR/AcrR family transcriptional regulator [Streptomyces sp. W16]|uniref:TetR/AcrR family transcriptional regulator n=1 Tax=Streptomyces sp. W16 TaxID=3076631 RepID=UPI00295BBD2F|nr:TetR/AcrR family transcriptional regulator [Streptomyces sp. W16]MDV9169078.1 TetR/AcrR family transcriptional regulator [Streptomyces sp. W16]
MPTSTKQRKLRADAERSIASIVSAALECVRADPQASLSAVARAAGVSRGTLYAHFPTREALLEAVVELSVATAAEALEKERLDEGPADEALARLIRSSWHVLDEHSSVFAASSEALTAERQRDNHERVLAPVEQLIFRGQQEGTLRADMPVKWLVAVLYNLMHTAAAEVRAKRLSARSAPEILVETLLSAMRLPTG